MKRVALLAISLFLTLTLVSLPVSAHRSGCHRWHSCPSDSGSYVCGDTGYSNYCGNGDKSSYSAPILSSKDDIIIKTIPITIKRVDNPTEYIGYDKVSTNGKNGSSKIITTIHYSDGVETYRDQPVESITEQQTPEIHSVGTRKIPTGYIDYIWKNDEPSFWSFMSQEYTIAAAASPVTNVALLKNNKVIDLGKSDATGSVYFRNVHVSKNDRLSLGSYEGGKVLWMMPKANPVSEIYNIDTEKLTVISEYDSAHKQVSKRIDEKNKMISCTDETAKKYLAQRSELDKRSDDRQNSVIIYYPDVCAFDSERDSKDNQSS